jgi:hypothetical protein
LILKQLDQEIGFVDDGKRFSFPSTGKIEDLGAKNYKFYYADGTICENLNYPLQWPWIRT